MSCKTFTIFTTNGSDWIRLILCSTKLHETLIRKINTKSHFWIRPVVCHLEILVLRRTTNRTLCPVEIIYNICGPTIGIQIRIWKSTNCSIWYNINTWIMEIVLKFGYPSRLAWRTALSVGRCSASTEICMKYPFGHEPRSSTNRLYQFKDVKLMLGL